MRDFLIDPMKNLESYKNLVRDIENNISPISTYGIIDESLGHMLYAIKEHTDKQTLIITYDELRAKALYEDLKSLGIEDLELLPKKELLFYDIDAHSYERTNQRLNIMSKLMAKKDLVVIASVEALLDKVLTKDLLNSFIQEISFGDIIDLDPFLKGLVDSGYERVNMVENIGQFSLRGGIIDFFPPNTKDPFRIELFDDEVDSIRSFDILSQRSVEIVDKVLIPPVKEVLILEEFKNDIIENLDKELKKANKNLKSDKEYGEKLNNKFNKYRELLEEGLFISNRDMILPFIPDKYIISISSYFKKDALVFLDEPMRIRERVDRSQEDFRVKFTDLYEIGEVLPSHVNMFCNYMDILEDIKARVCVSNSALLKSDTNLKPKAIYNFTAKSMVSYHNKMELLRDELNYYRYRGYKIVILSGTIERGERLKKVLLDFNIEADFYENREHIIKSNQIFITPGSLRGGFEYPAIKLIVISDKEIFGSSKRKSKRPLKRKKGREISFTDLNIGDYVVHENHGIGSYEGIEQLDIQGVKKDYLTIRYRGQDKLYVPIDQMNLLQKYIGGDTVKPRVNKLSSGEWARTKAKTKKAVEDMAEDLLQLYAKRESLKGYAFSIDGVWQRQFEDLFDYEETEGQLASIREIKKDMESFRPMDRLLCGDVGYGKTEVALRAAFKALMDGKQVAFLVPTTILAQQHYNTLMDRFSSFPVEIAMLSRFRTPKEQKISIEKLKRGMVDIVVGTHRLLSKDIKFKDLGLLIIDEEQRFGVKHKESLKKLKENIDVLTLTATPIPRTLHMSMVGIRDMSVIDEPPEERYPVQTYVVEFNEQMIRDAIIKEISRGGQIYFVYNRVETIDKMAERLKELVPEASFIVGHGQMAERQLEGVMMDFFNKEYDVLVCTTIIETGLDIPNVNTIIIYDSDKMGLSQLYQLRGRVGRSNRIAYGYFVYEKNKVLTEVAEQRLRAIKEFTEFGSGFKIAMRDLEIRGAGNLLGLEQHGHIGAIGYDLYVKFLNEAIRKLKGEKIEEVVDTTIDINIDGYIPVGYIQDEELKIQVYKKIATIQSIEEYMELIDELIDRFGDIPNEVQNLMDVSYIRNLASKNNIKNIIQIGRNIKLEFTVVDNLSLEFLNYISLEFGRSLSFDLSTSPSFNFRPRNDLIGELKTLIEKINGFQMDKSNI